MSVAHAPAERSRIFVRGTLVTAGVVIGTALLLFLGGAGLGQWLYPALPATCIQKGGTR